MGLATVFGLLALHVTNPTLVLVMLFAAQFFLWFYNGPINAILANSVPSALRVRAFALSLRNKLSVEAPFPARLLIQRNHLDVSELDPAGQHLLLEDGLGG